VGAEQLVSVGVWTDAAGVRGKLKMHDDRATDERTGDRQRVAHDAVDRCDLSGWRLGGAERLQLRVVQAAARAQARWTSRCARATGCDSELAAMVIARVRAIEIRLSVDDRR
jgi:hypothetical protein